MVMWVLLVGWIQAVDFRLTIEGVRDELLVDLPEDWNEGGSYPAVLFYHGTNGRPTTGMVRGHAGEKDWIVVGMGYARRGTFQLTPAGMEAEVRVLRQVREELKKRAGLDETRVYVAGFSKGGWVTGLLLQKEKWLAGGAILGAGHMHQLEAAPKPIGKGKPVFVGVGRHDRNYPFGVRAKMYFGKLGAEVEMEAWRDLGHEFPDYGSKGLREWLRLRNGEEVEKKELRVELEEILELGGFEKWWGLVEFRERPFVKAAGMVAEVDGLRGDLEKEPNWAREARMLRESHRLLGIEMGKKTIKNLEELVAGYARIAEFGKGSPQGQWAGKDSDRVGEILEAAQRELAEEQARRKGIEVEAEEDERRRIPRNPLVR